MAKCVEIEQKDDGTFTVSECAPKMEAVEPGEEPGGQQAQSLPQALQIAGQILAGAAEQDQQQAANTAFQAGSRPRQQGEQLL